MADRVVEEAYTIWFRASDNIYNMLTCDAVFKVMNGAFFSIRLDFAANQYFEDYVLETDRDNDFNYLRSLLVNDAIPKT